MSSSLLFINPKNTEWTGKRVARLVYQWINCSCQKMNIISKWPFLLSGCLQRWRHFFIFLHYITCPPILPSRTFIQHLAPKTSSIFIEELFPQVSHKTIKSTYPDNMSDHTLQMYFPYSKYITHAHTTNMSLILRGELCPIFTSNVTPNMCNKLILQTYHTPKHCLIFIHSSPLRK